jgi:hypothetical protein
MIEVPVEHPNCQGLDIPGQTGKHRIASDAPPISWAFIEPTDPRWNAFLERVPP